MKSTDGPMCDVECGSTLECTELGSDFACRDDGVCREEQKVTEPDAAAPEAEADSGSEPNALDDDTDVELCDPRATPFGGGEGTEADPYTLCTAEHLSAIQGEHLSKHFLLAEDLDLQGVAFEPIGGFIDVEDGDLDPMGGFAGVFDGGGHRISNLFIDRPLDEYVGLFSGIAGVVRALELFEPEISGSATVGALAGALVGEGEISEVRIVGGSVSSSLGGGLVGGLVGWSNGSIMSSSTTGFVSGSDAGGLVGSNEGSIMSSSATGDVSGGDLVGGVVGGLAGINHGSITSSSAAGDVSGFYRVAGLVGENHGSITSSAATGGVSGLEAMSGNNGRFGGLVGQNYGSITSSFATGGVSGDFIIGGFVGSNAGSITDSCATGSASGDNRVGGLVGLTEGIGSIMFSYATGFVSGESEVGGLIGAGVGGSAIISSYFNAASPDNDRGTPLLCADFAVQSNFFGWDFGVTWRMAATRPVLIWQEDLEEPDNACTP